MNNKKFYQILTEKDVKFMGGRVAPHEEFKPVPQVKGWFISSFGRLVSKRKNGNAKIVKTAKSHLYDTVITRVEDRNVKSFYIHQLVAHAFVEVPDWIENGDIIDVHHIQPVRKEGQEYINRASNLTYMPRKIHRLVDAIAEIAVYEGGSYRKYDFVMAAERLNLSPYILADVIRQEPTKKENNKTFYKCTVNNSGVAVDVDFYIIRKKDI